MASGLANLQGQKRVEPLKRSPRSWLWLRVAVISCLICYLYWNVLFHMALDWWQQPDLSQGMLLPPLALFVAWAERRYILSQPASRDGRGLILLAFACFMLAFGQLASEFFSKRFSFVLVIAGLIWAFWGIRRLRAVSFPLLLLAVMVPLPTLVYNMIAEPLQLLASSVATHFAQALGVSVYQAGNVIQLAHISLGVAEACSGLNSLSALIVGSLILGYLVCNRKLSRILLVILSVPLAVGVNVVRVAGTAVLADYNQEFAMGFYHMFSGWLVFVAGTIALYFVALAIHALLDRPKAAVMNAKAEAV
ncbi:MAG: exosortase/archaeosortase family protein [Bryobacteraceae bacterium]